MKNFIFILISIMLVIATQDLQAQRSRSLWANQSLWVNGMVGANSNWIINQNAYGNQEIEYAPTFGLTAGGGVNYFYTRDWGYSGSIYVSKLGQNYSGWQAGAKARRDVKLLYVEVPLLLMKQILYRNYPTWVAFGPDILILMNAKQDYSRNGGVALPNPEGMKSGDITERFNPVDIALNFSLNRMVDFNNDRRKMFLFSINSSIGLTDINRVPWQIQNTHKEYGAGRNFYIGFKAGMIFKISKSSGRRW